MSVSHYKSVVILSSKGNGRSYLFNPAMVDLQFTPFQPAIETEPGFWTHPILGEWRGSLLVFNAEHCPKPDEFFHMETDFHRGDIWIDKTEPQEDGYATVWFYGSGKIESV
jgi:hypothetical protein